MSALDHSDAQWDHLGAATAPREGPNIQHGDHLGAQRPVMLSQAWRFGTTGTPIWRALTPAATGSPEPHLSGTAAAAMTSAVAPGLHLRVTHAVSVKTEEDDVSGQRKGCDYVYRGHGAHQRLLVWRRRTCKAPTTMALALKSFAAFL